MVFFFFNGQPLVYVPVWYALCRTNDAIVVHRMNHTSFKWMLKWAIHGNRIIAVKNDPIRFFLNQSILKNALQLWCTYFFINQCGLVRFVDWKTRMTYTWNWCSKRLEHQFHVYHSFYHRISEHTYTISIRIRAYRIRTPRRITVKPWYRMVLLPLSRYVGYM